MLAGLNVKRARETCLGILSDQAGTERQFGNRSAMQDPHNREAVISQVEVPGGKNDRDAYYFPYGMPLADPMHIFRDAFERVVTEFEVWPEYLEGPRG